MMFFQGAVYVTFLQEQRTSLERRRQNQSFFCALLKLASVSVYFLPLGHTASHASAIDKHTIFGWDLNTT